MSDVQCERIGNMYDNSYGGGMDGNVYAPTVCAPTLKAIGGGHYPSTGVIVIYELAD